AGSASRRWSSAGSATPSCAGRKGRASRSLSTATRRTRRASTDFPRRSFRTTPRATATEEPRVVTARAMVRPAESRGSRILPDLLLLAGVLASVVYIAADMLCGFRYPGYSFTDQVISALAAIGALTAALWGTLLRG